MTFIDKFAEHFGLDPDFVYSEKSFEVVMTFLTMWKEQDEFQERFNQFYKAINK